MQSRNTWYIRRWGYVDCVWSKPEESPWFLLCDWPYPRFYLHQHPMAVFGYAVKHNYRPLADKAAQLTLKYPLKEIETCLNGNIEVVRHWVSYNIVGDNFLHLRFCKLQYREGWTELLRSVHTHKPPFIAHKNNSCTRWSSFHRMVLESMDVLTFDPGDLSNFKEIISRHKSGLENCQKCATRATSWCAEVDTKRNELPLFSTFLWN